MIEDYLDALQVRLRGTPRDIRRMLRETEDHLNDSAAAGIDSGRTPEDAQRDAVERFGSIDDIARRFNRSAPMPRLRAGLLLEQAATLGGITLVAIGLSGAVAAAMIGLAGSSFVFADAPGRTYAAAACHHWLSLHPSAHTCAQAALAENVSDGLMQRFAAGLVGIVVLAALAWRLKRHGRSARQLLSTPLVAIVGATGFGAAGVVLLGFGFDAIQARSGNGAGQWLSAGGVSLIVAALFAVTALRQMPTLSAEWRVVA